MIPKIIHYCWFGGKELPYSAKKCINSWKKYCPEYEIKKWDETNFDFSDCRYAREAYEAKKWAFVSDYARFKILYENGGIYFDIDVELIKPIEHIVNKGPFIGCEICRNKDTNKIEQGINPGVGMATCKGHLTLKEILEIYKTLRFIQKDQKYDYTTIVWRMTTYFRKYGFDVSINNSTIQTIKDFNIYPHEYFCPYNNTINQLIITSNTIAIHYFNSSWYSSNAKIEKAIKKHTKGKSEIIVWIGKVVAFPFSLSDRIAKYGFKNTMKYYYTGEWKKKCKNEK